jgi:Tfp pilus assembly protein PilO
MLLCRKPRIFDIDLLALAAVFGICVLTWLFVLQPLEKKLLQQRTEQQQVQEDNESAQTQLSHLQNLVKQRQVLAASLRKTKNILKDSMGTPDVIRRMGQLCRRCGIRLDEITPGAVQPSTRYHRRTLLMRMHGSYPQVHAMLSKLNEEIPYVRVRTLTLQQAGQTQIGRCSVTLHLDVFGPHWQQL